MVNAANTGTSGLLISHIGISAGGAGVVGGALQGEIKRLTTFAGQVVADDTIHVTIRDDTTAVYSLRAFALYLQDGTLLAWYAQAGVILEKSELAMLLLSADLQFQNLDVTSLEFGDSNWTNPIATTTVFGVLRLATNEAALAGISQVDAVTPASLFSVLNVRFGVGAPSDFVKTLLNLATAALFRTAIGLGNVATRNEGHGNGLDADLLDGQHGAYYRDWGNLTNKPATFVPSAHDHAWSDLIGVPATATRWPTFMEVTDKPATYPPSAHAHAAADITSGVLDVQRIPDIAMAKVTGLQGALDGKAPTAHNHDATQIATGTFAVARIPALPISQTTGLQAALDGKVLTNLSNANGVLPDGCLPARLRTSAMTIADWNAATENGWYMADNAANAPGASWYIGEVDAHNTNWVTQTVRQFTGDGSTESRMFRRDRNNGAWNPWTQLLSTLPELDARYAVRGANVTLRDITASRGDGTGVIFLNAANDRYLYWDNSRYMMPGGALNVAGGFDFGSSRKLKNIDGVLPYGLDEVERIETLIGRYKPEYVDDGRVRLFFDAEQLAEIIPEAVDVEGVEFNGERVPTVKIEQMLPVLSNAIRQLAGKVRVLSDQVESLKASA